MEDIKLYNKATKAITNAIFNGVFAKDKYVYNIRLYHNVPIKVFYPKGTSNKMYVVLYSKERFEPYMVLVVAYNNGLYAKEINIYRSNAKTSYTFKRLQKSIGNYDFQRINYWLAPTQVANYYKAIWERKAFDSLNKTIFNSLVNF